MKWLFLFITVFLISCSQDEPIQQSAAGLQKITNPTEAQIQQLVNAGAEIIVREPDYIVIRTEKMTEPLAFSSSAIQETDLVQRLVHVYVPDTTALQTVINSGVDFWQVDGDTAVARAFDIYIKDLRQAGLDVRIVAQDASAWAEGLK